MFGFIIGGVVATAILSNSFWVRAGCVAGIGFMLCA